MRLYKHTLNLPQTDLPIKLKPQIEVDLVKKWDEDKLYYKIIESRDTCPSFTLHDGPPYANGHLHHGHILNKVLKDIVVKSKTMLGYRAEFRPGWDCHGLPIETAVDKKLGPKRHEMSKLDLRQVYREYADEFVDIQREEFKRLGVLASWDNPYKTMDSDYEAQTLRELAKFARADLLYRDLKPVFWCPTHRTALANSDIEYKNDHVSKSVFVLFPLVDKIDEYIAVWTTTPWTLLANEAVAVNARISYAPFRMGDRKVWVAADLIDNMPVSGVQTERTSPGTALTREKYHHPLSPNKVCPVVLSDHVTAESGTGFVHIAPAHGEDDFRVGYKYGLPIESAINHNGKSKYGLNVSDTTDRVIAVLGNHILGIQSITHSYPYSTRSHKPVITKATDQWFIDIDKPYNDGPTLRERALLALDEVNWLPEHGYKRIKGMLENRPDWCISRQRTWGVPIVAFHCTKCDTHSFGPNHMELYAKYIVEKGKLDESFDSPLSDFPCEKCGADVTLETDILDVWFDSGVSNAVVMGGEQADLYLEGSDQHRGWFQSSLLAALGANESIPFKTVLTHGFVVDENGEKLSKSKNNYKDPFKLIDQYGSEVLRLWVANSEYRNDIKFSEESLKGIRQTHHKIRNTVRFLLSNLYDFDMSNKVKQLTELDRYMLMLSNSMVKIAVEAYKNYEFHKVVKVVEDFCNLDLSSFYFEVVRDNLYCDEPDSHTRRSSQMLMYMIARQIIQVMAPIMCFTTEEIWQKMPVVSGSVHMSKFIFSNKKVDDRLIKKYNELRKLRREIYIELERARNEKLIGPFYEADVYLTTQLDRLYGASKEELARLLSVSRVFFTESDDHNIKVLPAWGMQCQRCWSYFDGLNVDTCDRCHMALNYFNKESK